MAQQKSMTETSNQVFYQRQSKEHLTLRKDFQQCTSNNNFFLNATDPFGNDFDFVKNHET